MEPLTHVDLFSGIGGFSIAAKWNGIRTVAMCEIDERCRAFLFQLRSDGTDVNFDLIYYNTSGTLRLAFTATDGKIAADEEIPFSLEPLGAQSYVLSIKAPAVVGKYTLEAIAIPADDKDHPTSSHRDVTLEPANAH